MQEYCTVTFKPGLAMEQRFERESQAAGARSCGLPEMAERKNRRLVASSAVTATTASSSSASPAATFFAWFGFINGQRAAVLLFSIEPLDGRLSLLIGAHLDEAKSFAAAGITVLNYLGTADLPKG